MGTEQGQNPEAPVFLGDRHAWWAREVCLTLEKKKWGWLDLLPGDQPEAAELAGNPLCCQSSASAELCFCLPSPGRKNLIATNNLVNNLVFLVNN